MILSTFYNPYKANIALGLFYLQPYAYCLKNHLTTYISHQHAPYAYKLIFSNIGYLLNRNCVTFVHYKIVSILFVNCMLKRFAGKNENRHMSLGEDPAEKE